MHRVFLLAVGTFALGMGTFIISGLIPEIATATHTAESMVGQMVTVFTLCYAVSGPLFSSVLTKLSTKTILLASIIVFTIGNIGTAASESFAVLLLSRAVAGVGAGLYSPTAAAAAAYLVPPEQRGRALSVILGGLSVGTVVGVPLGMLLARAQGWQSALWLLSGVGIVATIGIARFMPRLQVDAPPGIKARLGTLVDRRVTPIVLVSVLFNIASLGLYTYIAPVLRATAGITNPTLYLWIWGIGGIIGAFAIGPFIDRSSSTTRVMLVVLAALIVAMAAITPAGSVIAVLCVAVAVWGAAGFGSPPPQQHLLLERAPDRGAVAVAVNASAIYLGSAIGSSLGGIALQAGVSAAALPMFASGFAVLAAIAYVTLVMPNRAPSLPTRSVPSGEKA